MSVEWKTWGASDKCGGTSGLQVVFQSSGLPPRRTKQEGPAAISLLPGDAAQRRWSELLGVISESPEGQGS